MFLWWIPAILAGIACLGAAVTFAVRFRPRPLPPGVCTDGLTVIVPIKGIDHATERNLTRLVTSRVAGPVEYLVAMESAEDPAFAVAHAVRKRHPGIAIEVVVTGPSGERMGKQHNLAVAAVRARYGTVASMDADVLVGPDTLATGLSHLSQPGAGVVYFLPCYRGTSPAGGLLVAIYANYYYQLNMGAMALTRDAAFITGGLWLMSAEAYRRIGGFDRFTTTVSDDAAIGRAVASAGLRNILVPATVDIDAERVGLRGGVRHLLKWLAMLRAEGLATYAAIALSWHPVLLATVAMIVTGNATGSWAWATVLLSAVVTVRVGGALVLHARAYGWREVWLVALLPLYEVVVVPAVFGWGAFVRSLIWRGRRYRIGARGAILADTPPG